MAAPEMRYHINLMEDGSVITESGEYLGTWDINETDAIYQFTPDGADKPIFLHPFVPWLCDMIEEWHKEQNATTE